MGEIKQDLHNVSYLVKHVFYLLPDRNDKCQKIGVCKMRLKLLKIDDEREFSAT